jgi:hypothetical protein
MARRTTTEWGNRSAGGPRRSRRFPKIAGALVLLVAVFFVGRWLQKPGDGSVIAESDPVSALDTGGSSSAPIEEILSGRLISIPVGDSIVLDDSVVDEANIAQDTTEVLISEGALETALDPVVGNHGSGVATSDMADGRFQHVAVATLPYPPEGYFYEGWLIRSRPFDFFSTGVFIQHADDLKWYLVWDSPEDKRDFKKVIVTLEPDDGDEAPSEHVLEGAY